MIVAVQMTLAAMLFGTALLDDPPGRRRRRRR
jgi:hypothetical protein